MVILGILMKMIDTQSDNTSVVCFLSGPVETTQYGMES